MTQACGSNWPTRNYLTLRGKLLDVNRTHIFINGSEKIGVIIEHDFKAQSSNRKEIYLLYSHTEYRCIFSELQSIKKEAGVTLLLLL